MAKNRIIEGKFISNERGFGFVEWTDEEDIFIPPNMKNGSMDGDIVKVKIMQEKTTGHRAEGKIVEILVRNTQTVVGNFQKSQNYGFVVPDNRNLGTDIFISKKSRHKAKNGDKVVVRIKKYPTDRKNAEGEIIEILGKAKNSSIDILSVIRNHNYKLEFPKEVEKEAKILPDVIHDIDGRTDLRDVEIFTIDGDDTKDIDDAISLIKKGDKYVLGVHIADVSYYVQSGTALDKEAARRGTSVYLIDTVIPMLPKKLSNGICSLNPGCDRYALSVEMIIDSLGNVIDRKIFKSVINSKLQMTYNKVYNILENGKEYAEYMPHVNTLKNMKELAEILIDKKDKAGAVDFNMPEAKIILDENDVAVEIGVRENTIANRIIEEFMILANETVAELFNKRNLPFIYRIHEKPEEDRIEKFNTFLISMNYPTISKIENSELKKIANFAKGKSEEKLVLLMMLRTMQLAKYSNENMGHFGLASKYYCHFTSPIRRYPDLFIHRVISEYLANELNDKKISKFKKLAVKYTEMSSDSEQEEEEAECELYEIKKCEYMSNHIGEEFLGTVSGVTSFGLFVELDNTVEGLIRMEDLLDDYYIYDEENVRLVGKRTNQIYKLGDSIKVKVIKADKILRRIDFQKVDLSI